MDNLLSVAAPEGSFVNVTPLKGGPVPEEEVVRNIRDSASFNAPVFKKNKAERDGSFIFCAGGPTLREHLDEIRERSRAGEFICTSNKTYDYLIDNDIIPTACFVLDPKECVKDYIKKPNPATTFYIGTVCNVQVAQKLLEAGCNVEKLLLGYGLESGEDVKLQTELYPGDNSFLCGGTMAGLRAMNFGQMLGFKVVEYYGFDSCFSTKKPPLIVQGDPGFDEAVERNKGISYQDSETNTIYTIDEPEDGGFFYSYYKKRGENIQIARTPDGDRFYTSPCFAHQAQQAIKWIDRLEDKVEIVIHGYSLTSKLLEGHRKIKAQKKEKIGDARWTEGYAELQRKLHETGKYGLDGKQDVEFIGRSVLSLAHRLDRPLRVLDYGCGNGAMGRELERIFRVVNMTYYDPFIPERSAEPEGEFDLVTCFDVMEHIEEECVENTLKYIAKKTKLIAMFFIALDEAEKTLEDGRNAHITQHHAQWWANRLEKYFIIGEAASMTDKNGSKGAMFVCQALEAVDNLQ